MGQAQGGNSGNLELLRKFEELKERMNSKIYELEELIIFSSDIQGYSGNVVVCGNTIDVFFSVRIANNSNAGVGSIKQKYRPKNEYIILPIYSLDAPYAPANGSLWISKTGNVNIYGAATGEAYYTCGSWVF